MKNLKLYVLTGALTLACLSSVTILWREPALLTAFLLVIGACMVAVGHSWKRDAIFFVAGGLWGAFAEVIAMAFGSYPWFYAEPHLLGIPYYLPLIWGCAGIMLVRMAEGIKEFFGL